MKLIKLSRFHFGLLLVLIFSGALAQQMFFHLLPHSRTSFVWVGKGVDTNWSTADNWSTQVVPGASDKAIFNDACIPFQCNVTFDSNVAVKGFDIQSTYTGTINQGTYSLTLGSDGFVQAAGIFSGGSGNITSTGIFSITGGVFTSTSGTLTASTHITINSPTATFNHSSGTFIVQLISSTTRTINTGTAQFNHVQFYGNSDSTNITVTGTMNVLGNFLCHGLTTGSAFINSGTISVAGNLDFMGSGCLGTGTITASGSTNQTITGASTTSMIPNFVVNSSGGTVSLSGTIVFAGNFTYSAGTVSAGTSSVHFPFQTATTQTISAGSIQFYDVTFAGVGLNAIKTITGSLISTNSLTCSSTGSTGSMGSLNVGTINARGNLSFSGIGCRGTATFVVDGNTNQSITGVAGAFIPNFQINSTGGVVSLVGTLLFVDNFTYTAGTVDAGTSTVIFFSFDATTRTIIVSSSIAFNIVRFTGSVGGAIKEIAGTLVVDGDFDCTTAGARGVINSGLIRARGNLSFVTLGCNGTTQIEVDGSGVQTITGVANAFIPKITINSTGTVNFSGTLDFYDDFVYSSGTVVAGTSTARFYFISNSTKLLSLASGIEFNNVWFGGSAYTPVRSLTGDLIVRGDLQCASATNVGSINGGAIQIYGSFNNSNGCQGNTQISMLGTSSANLSKDTQLTPTTDFIINKPGATVTMLNNFDFTNVAPQNFNLVNGILNVNGMRLIGINTLTVDAGTTINCNGGEISALTIVNNGTINCPGYSSYPFHWSGAGGDTNWNNALNWSGGVVPGASDTAAFSNAYCGANCNATFNVNPNVRGIRLLSDYTGTITQPSGVAISIGSLGWVQNGGTFLGSDASQTILNTLIVNAGSFRATSGLLTINSSSTSNMNAIDFAAGATFDHNGGSLYLDNGTGGRSKNYDFGGDSVNNIYFKGSAVLSWLTPSDVLGDATIDVGAYSARVAGQLNLHGNLTITRHETHTTTLIRFVGTNNQTVTTTGVVDAQTSRIGRIIFDKPSGNVTFTGNISVAGIEYIQAGTVTFPPGTTTTFWYYDSSGNPYWIPDITTPGPLEFANVNWVDASPRTISGTMKVLENLTINLGNYEAELRGGKIQVHGDLNLINDYNVNSSTEIEFVGTTNSTVTSAAGKYLPGTMSISKTGGGVVNLASNTSVRLGEADVIMNSGTLNMNGFNLTIGTATGVNNILRLESGTIVNRGGGTLTYEALTNNGGTINP